ncbi:hypothetical protein DYBT9623_02130 [Dyadobacter sp. CECT 9623]|uniref:Uncharacterized protein n=1 Tax=Dyadobacter linearis TaxID=2823330 RepID=A0ABM8UPI3_9BACT|nr:hypothetical protein [Dyadobacter sp. CECT 9623]CAG5069394.1 hypothetical protein DYBT9623_02130 [Dyadobacter sp. CECT 9623]
MKRIGLILALLLSFSGFTSKSDFSVSDFSTRNITFNGLYFPVNKEAIIRKFGQGKIVQTDYECGAYSAEQEKGPYYQLAYKNFNFIGSDKEDFMLENVVFDAAGKTVVIYQKEILNGFTTKAQFITIFGSEVERLFENGQNGNTVLLQSKDSDDGLMFTFERGRLVKMEYWSPC